MVVAEPCHSEFTARSTEPVLSIIQPVSDAIQSLPSTRFYGSKRKLLSWIYAKISHLKFETALDLFGGTASVSLLFKTMRKSVSYHDGLQFNEDVGRTVLAQEQSVSRSDLLYFLKTVTPRVGVISKLFEGVFYTTAENMWLDGFCIQLNEAKLSLAQKSLLRYLLYQACLRKRPFNIFHRANLGLRTNGGIKRSFGNLATWERSFDLHMLQAYEELPCNAPEYQRPSTILSSRNAEEVPAGYDLVYIDPPYISLEERRNWDDYWRRYHFLEGLARYHEWEQLIDLSSNIRLFQAPEWITVWSRRRTFTDRLFSLIERHSSSIVLFSYVKHAYPHDSIIQSFLESKFSDVSIHTRMHNHALSRSQKRELLFIGYPR